MNYNEFISDKFNEKWIKIIFRNQIKQRIRIFHKYEKKNTQAISNEEFYKTEKENTDF